MVLPVRVLTKLFSLYQFEFDLIGVPKPLEGLTSALEGIKVSIKIPPFTLWEKRAATY
jgi:hypothetical protein